MTNSIVSSNRYKVFNTLAIVIMIGVTILALIDFVKHGGDLFSSLAIHIGYIFFFYFLTYRPIVQWLSLPQPSSRKLPVSEKYWLVIGLVILTVLIGALIVVTFAPSLYASGNSTVWVILIIPYCAFANWVFTAWLLGDTSHLPWAWKAVWLRVADAPDNFQPQDRSKLVFAVLGVLAANAVTFYQAYQSGSGAILQWIILGTILTDLFAMGAFYWAFHWSWVWGVIVLVLWVVGNTFLMGTALATNLGLFFEWLAAHIGTILFIQ